MATDPTSLDRLHDIVVAPLVPWWPPAPGWLWLMGIAGVLALALLLRWFVHRQRNRYRREALADVARLVTRLERGDTPAGVRLAVGELAVVLKRTAMTAYTRGRVAALTGDEWYAFLDRSAGTRFSDGLGARMERVVYGDAGADAATARDVAAETRGYVRDHKIRDHDRGAGESAQHDAGRASPDPPRPRGANAA